MSVAVADLNARTQNFFREVNERIANVNAGMSRPDEDSGRLIEVLCECGRQSCATLLRIREDDYELLRSNPIGFVVCVGHESAPVEEVVQRATAYSPCVSGRPAGGLSWASRAAGWSHRPPCLPPRLRRSPARRPPLSR